MKSLLSLLMITTSVLANTHDAATQAAAFNKWYVTQISENHFPITDNHEIDRYVTASTMQKLRHTQDPDYDDEPFYDADFFLKAQDIGEDWPDNINVVSVDTDPICVNIYIAFGKNKAHTIIDCMVRENGRWKVQSVAARDIK